MRREPQQPRPLGERLADEPDVELLEVAQAAVDQAAGPRRRPRRDVVLLDERDPQAARGGVEQRARRRRSRRRRSAGPSARRRAARGPPPAASSGDDGAGRCGRVGHRRGRSGLAARAGCATARTPCRPPARTISSGVWNTTAWPSRGRSAVIAGREQDDGDGDGRDQQHVADPGLADVRHGRPPAGSRSARRARGRRAPARSSCAARSSAGGRSP